MYCILNAKNHSKTTNLLKTKHRACLCTETVLKICLFNASSPNFSTAAAWITMPPIFMIEGPFLHNWKPLHADQVRPPKKMASTTNSFLWHIQEQKRKIMIISLQVNKNRTKCVTSAPAFWVLAWECAGSASMLHSSLLKKEDGDLRTGLYCHCQMSPHVVKTIHGGVLHLTNHTLCLFSVRLTLERCSTPSNQPWWHPAFPYRGQMVSHCFC